MKIPAIITLALTTLITPLTAQTPKAELELFATTDQAVGNIAFTNTGQLIMSHHPFFKPQNRVVSYNSKTKTTAPFPNKKWNTPRTTDDHYLDDVLGIRNDDKGIIWMLDMGTRNNITPKLVAWNTNTNKLHRILYIPAPATNQTSQPNDFVIDTKRNLIVIADEGIGRGGNGNKAALIVININTGKTRRILEDHPTTRPDRNKPILINGKPMSVQKDGKNTPIFVGADGITLDAENQWLYYCPLNGEKIYRIKMDLIANPNLTEKDLTAGIQNYSQKFNNGGLTADTAGNLYTTNVEAHSIGIITAKDRKLHTLATDKRMLWPDGISTSPDGYMYISAAQVHLGKPFNNGTDKTSKPFYIFRLKPLAPGIIGR